MFIGGSNGDARLASVLIHDVKPLNLPHAPRSRKGVLLVLCLCLSFLPWKARPAGRNVACLVARHPRLYFWSSLALLMWVMDCTHLFRLANIRPSNIEQDRPP
jgi:hypothetical protein